MQPHVERLTGIETRKFHSRSHSTYRYLVTQGPVPLAHSHSIHTHPLSKHIAGHRSGTAHNVRYIAMAT